MLLVILIAIGFGVWAIRRAALTSRYTPEEHEAAVRHLLDAQQEHARHLVETYGHINTVPQENQVGSGYPHIRDSRCRCCTYWDDINADPYNEYGGLLDGGDYDINSGRRCTCGHARCRGYQAGLYR